MMHTALQLFDVLGISYVPPSQRRDESKAVTHCGPYVDRLIKNQGLPHVTIVLRTIVESEGNAGELIADVIGAVSDVVLAHPRWVELGLAFIEAFDKISLAEIRNAAKATGVVPLRAAITTLLCVELDRLLGPSVLPRPPKAIRVKDAKQARALTRVPGVEKNIALGLELLELRRTFPHNMTFGRQVRRQFEIDGQEAGEAMKVARLYAARPEIYTRLSWQALLTLSSPKLTAAVREALESRIIAGERVGAPEVRKARGALKSGRPSRPADRLARMA